jgi:hypothetical protein
MTKNLKAVVSKTEDDEVSNINIKKIECLTELLSTSILDDEKNGGYGSDVIYQNAFNPSERKAIKIKIFKIMEEL